MIFNILIGILDFFQNLPVNSKVSSRNHSTIHQAKKLKIMHRYIRVKVKREPSILKPTKPETNIRKTNQ